MRTDDDFVWSADKGVVTVNGHIVLTMPLRPGVLLGRTHTATCTLCRDKQIAAGHAKGSNLGQVGFFKSESHRDLAVKAHVARHKSHGEEVHIVNLPERLPAVTEQESHARQEL